MMAPQLEQIPEYRHPWDLRDVLDFGRIRAVEIADRKQHDRQEAKCVRLWMHDSAEKAISAEIEMEE